MTPRLLDSPLYYALLGVLCGTVGFRLGWRVPFAAGLPVVATAIGYAAFALAWQRSGVIAALLTEGGWAVGLTLASLHGFSRASHLVDRRVLRARGYREEMLVWLRDGRGPQTRPLVTLGRHTVELTVYLAAAVVSANLLSMLMGAVLLNSMNAYVTRLFAAARNRTRVGLLAWNSWSVVRVAAYVLLGTACAAPLAARAGYPAPPPTLRWLVGLGAAGVVLDLALKLALAGPCGRALEKAVDWSHFAPPEAAEPSGAPCE